MQSKHRHHWPMWLMSIIVLLLVSGCASWLGDGPGGGPAPGQTWALTRLAAAPTTVAVGANSAISATVTNPDAVALTYTWTGGGGTVVGTGAAVTWSHTVAGNYVVSVRVSDGTNSKTLTVNVTVTDPGGGGQTWALAGLAAVPASVETGVDSAITATVTNPDATALTYTWTGGGGTVVGTGAAVTWSHTTAGTYTVSVTVSDGTNESTMTVDVTVTDPVGGGDPQGYIDADGFNGGLLYDKFWATETGWDQGDPNLTTFGDSSNFFRCKQCHGWDLLGNTGAYISRAPKTSRPNVTGLNLHTIAAGMTPQALFDALKSATNRRGLAADLSTYDPDTNAATGDQMPDYGSFMTDGQLWDLVKFLKATAIDTSTLYDSVASGSYPTGSMAYSNIGLDGDAANGDTIYSANCVVCHGADGTKILVDGDEYTLGSFFRAKPNEAQHKIKYGNPGTGMGSLVPVNSDVKDMYKALADPVNYPGPVAADIDAMLVADASEYYTGDAAGWSSVSGVSHVVSASSAGFQTTGNPSTGGHGDLGEANLVTINMKAVHDGTNFAFRYEWDDDTQNDTGNFWTNNTGTWERSGNEDRLYMMFETGDPTATGRMGQTFSEVGCAMVCHGRFEGGNTAILDTTTELHNCSYCHVAAPGLQPPTFVHMETTLACDTCHEDRGGEPGPLLNDADMISPSADATYDVWHWKAGRSNPLGIVDDQYLPPALRRKDDGGGLNGTNSVDSASVGSAVPLNVFTDDRADGATSWLFQSETAAMVASDELATWDEANAGGPGYYLSDGTTPFVPADGATVPRNIHNDTDIVGDRTANTFADGTYAAGKWTLVVHRAMAPGEVDDNGDPTDKDFVAGETYTFGLAVTNSSGHNHKGKNLNTIMFE